MRFGPRNSRRLFGKINHLGKIPRQEFKRTLGLPHCQILYENIRFSLAKPLPHVSFNAAFSLAVKKKLVL